MRTMRTIERTVVVAGSAGTATGADSFTVPPCLLHAVVLDYTSQPGTTDVTIANLGRNILVRSNSGTDAVVKPREKSQDNAGADTADAARELPYLSGTVTIAVAQGDAHATGLVVTFVLDVL